MRLLVIEDEQTLADSIKKGFTEQGFAVDTASNGEDGLFLAENETYDAVILDRMLPLMDGVEICKSLRRNKIETPILMLTALSELDDKVTGLDAGADDYLTKPFEFLELKSRVNALLRRRYRQTSSIICIADLQIDTAKHTVARGGKSINLTPKEFSILVFLAMRQGEIVTRSQILDHTWDYNYEGMSNVVDVFIGSLRKKIDDGRMPRLLQTIRGVGYSLSMEDKHA